MTELPVAFQIVHAHLEIIVETPTVRERIIPQEFRCILCLTLLCTLLGIIIVFMLFFNIFKTYLKV